MPHKMESKRRKFEACARNYTVLQDLWDAVLEITLEPEVRSHIIGVKAQIESIHFSFGVCVGKHVNNLSTTLESSTISSAEGQREAELTISTLGKMQDEEDYHLFWELIRRKGHYNTTRIHTTSWGTCSSKEKESPTMIQNRN